MKNINFDLNLISNKVPQNVKLVSAILQNNGFEAYIVGGCVRDLLLGREPNDFDITTNANPEQIISLFPRTFYENSYGTVGVVTASLDEKDESVLKKSIVEVTPYRIESDYEDKRHPNEVKWSLNIHEDLKRRDFTCNAMALNLTNLELIDDFGGLSDIENKVLRAVGDPVKRFSEDALRILRLVRFAAQLDFSIEKVTHETAKNMSETLKFISRERIRDEFCKMIMSNSPKYALELAHETGILKFISHEIELGIGVSQNQAHKFDVWEHNLRTCQHAADKNWPLELRLAALFHDVSKPETRRYSPQKKDYTFYGHDVVGGRVSREIMERLKFPKDTIEYVSSMVRWHMFFSDTEQITLSAVRRLITNIGKDNIWDLMNLRICDRVGTGRPKEEPYRFRKYQSLVEQALTDAVSLKQLKIDGKRIMEVTHETPGPKIGLILNALFGEVLDDSSKNTEDYLEKRALELVSCEISVLKNMAEKGKTEMEIENGKKIDEIKKQFHVK